MNIESNLIKFNQGLNDYYKLKRLYESRTEKEVTKLIKNDNLTNKEKQIKLRQFKLTEKCINCGKLGGTIFKQEANILLAKCGHIERPCKLDIQIQKAKYANIIDQISDIANKINTNKTETIRSKLNFLFGFSNEKNTIEIFNKFKQELIDEVKNYQKINEVYLNIVHNLSKTKEVNEKNNNLLVLIQNFKDLIKEFEDTGDFTYIKDAIELYIGSIDETAENIRNLKYTYNSIEFNENDKTDVLIQEAYTRLDLLTPINNTQNKIISFIR